MQCNREFVLKAIKVFGGFLEVAPVEFKENRKVVLKAIRNWGYAWRYTSENLRNDPEIVLEGMKHSLICTYFRWIPQELRSNREFILEAFRVCGSALPYTIEDVRKSHIIE